MCSGVVDVESTDPFYEALHPSLLKDTHQRRSQSFGSIGGNLGDSGLGTSSLLDEATSDLLEFEVAGNIGGDKDVGQLARRHQKLRYEVDVPVVGSAVLLPWLLTFCEVAILLE